MSFALVRNDVLLGRVDVASVDMPWFEGRFEPTVAFGEVRKLFDLELELLDTDRMDEFIALWDEMLEGGLRLVPDDGSGPIAEFILHVEGDRCRFRY